MYISGIVSVRRGAKDVPMDRQVTNVPETKGFPNSYIMCVVGSCSVLAGVFRYTVKTFT